MAGYFLATASYFLLILSSACVLFLYVWVWCFLGGYEVVFGDGYDNGVDFFVGKDLFDDCEVDYDVFGFDAEVDEAGCLGQFQKVSWYVRYLSNCG